MIVPNTGLNVKGWITFIVGARRDRPSVLATCAAIGIVTADAHVGHLFGRLSLQDGIVLGLSAGSVLALSPAVYAIGAALVSARAEVDYGRTHRDQAA